MLPNLPGLLPTRVKQEDLSDDLATLSISCDQPVATSNPSAGHELVEGVDSGVVGSLCISPASEPCQSNLPLPDPFAQTATMHAPFPQGGHDLAMAHDFLKKQCFLLPVSLSRSFPSLTNRQHGAVRLPSHEYSLPFPKLDPPTVSRCRSAASLSETPAKEPSPVDNDSDTASFHAPERLQFTFSVTPPRPTNDTLQREPLVASIPSKSRCPAQPESDCFGKQILKPRRRSTGEIVLPYYTSLASIQQPTLSATPVSLSETPAKETRLIDNDSDTAPSFPFPERFQFTFSVTPPRPTNDTLQYNSNPELEPFVANFPSRSQCPPQPESDCFREQTLKHRRRSTGEIVFLDYTLPTSIQQPAISSTPARPNAQHSTSEPSYVETYASNSSISTQSQISERAARSSTPPPKRLPSGGLMVTPNGSRASSLSSASSRASSRGRSVFCGEPTSTGEPCTHRVKVSDVYFDGLGEPFEGICWQHNLSHPSYRGSSASPSPGHHKQRSRTTSSASQNHNPPLAGNKMRCDGNSYNRADEKWHGCTKPLMPALAIEYRQMQDKDEDDEQDVPIKQFCPTHCDAVLNNEAVFPISRVLSHPVKFDEYIPRYLHPTTKAALRCMMEAPPSEFDGPGYIYAFHLQAGNDEGHVDDETVFLKVGRAVNVPKRIDQWAKQCPSKMQTLRGYWPFPTQQSTNGSTCTESLIKGCYMPQHTGPFHHRVERLVQIELADLVVHRQYLDPDFPNINTESASFKSSNSTAGKHLLHRVKCSDCSRVHREIFPLNRIREGKYKNGEWEYVVKPVIQRWGKFVKEYVDIPCV